MERSMALTSFVKPTMISHSPSPSTTESLTQAARTGEIEHNDGFCEHHPAFMLVMVGVARMRRTNKSPQRRRSATIVRVLGHGLSGIH